MVSQKQNCFDLHIVNSSVTKVQAIAELLKVIQIKPENTFGVGGGHNYFHLFNAVGHKVAMGNTVDELRIAADEIIGSVQDNGLASYLDQLANK